MALLMLTKRLLKVNGGESIMPFSLTICMGLTVFEISQADSITGHSLAFSLCNSACYISFPQIIMRKQ